MRGQASAMAISAIALLAPLAAGSAAGSVALSFGERVVAGGTARALSQALLYPADALRTLAQTRSGAKSLEELGAKTLVSGCATTSAFAYGIGAIQFGVIGTVTPVLGPLCASAAGAIASCVVSVPQEVIKQRLMVGIYPSFRVAVASIWRDEGARGFYTGWLPTISRNVPFVVCTFTTFAALERRCLRARDGTTLTAPEAMRIGVLSALAAGFATQPVDVVKTRLMTQAAASGCEPYAGVADCVATMWRTEGPRAFYRGLGQRAAYTGPLWATQFSLNARLSGALRERRRRLRRAATEG